MKNAILTSGAVVTGLLLGGIVGFMVGQSTREKVNTNTATSVNDGVVTVSVDIKNAAKQGVLELFR